MAVKDLVAIACFTGDSGLTDYSVSLARELAKTHAVVLLTSDRLAAPFHSMGFQVESIFRRSRWYPVDVLRFLVWCLVNRPKVLSFQAQLKVPALEGLLVMMLRLVGIRCVLTVHDVLPHYARPWSRSEFGWFYRRFDGLVVHSAAAQTAVRDLGVTSPILVVPHGVYDIFRRQSPQRDEARRRIGLAGDSHGFCALFFGHLEPRKGLMQTLRVAERMQHVPGLRFVFAGKNDLASHSSELAAEMSRASALPNVHVRAERIPFEEVENYFSACDLVLLPYLEGSTSGVLKLAIAFGLPVVASKVGDLPEQVPSGAGVLIEPERDLVEEQLAAGIMYAMQNAQDMRQAMANAAQGCDWKDIAAKYHSFMACGLRGK